MSTVDVATFLADRSLFRDLPPAAIAALADASKAQRFSAGERILRRGATGDALYVLVEGTCEVSRAEGNGRRVVAMLGPGDIFGEMALFTDQPRSADVTVTAEGQSLCLRIERGAVERLIDAQPLAARLLTSIVGRRLREPGTISQVGKYRIIREIARGGSAIVYEGIHPGLGRTVAIKMLPHELVREDDFLERFVDEARMVAELQHENIVQVFDTENAYATCFIVMERLEGQELKEVLQSGAASAEETLHVVRQIARALGYAHRRGIIHSDVKPSNIFLEETGRAKLMDFGIAAPPRVVKDEPARGILGTPGYVAPEMLTGGVVDGRADLYGLGIVAYEMRTGQRAFEGADTVQTLRDQMSTGHLLLPDDMADESPALAHVIARCTQLEPEDRFASAEELLETLGGRASILRGRARGASLTVVHPSTEDQAVQRVLQHAERQLNEIDGVRAARATFDL